MSDRKPSRQDPAVRQFILRNVRAHPEDIAALTAERLGLSRTAVARTLGRLVDEGTLAAEGRTKGRRYALGLLVDDSFKMALNAHVEEDQVWRFLVAPHLADFPPNILGICQYGFTEMLNNAVDHSTGLTAIIGIRVTGADVELTVADNGVGIFRKIQTDFGLADQRSALLELSKGKLTSDKKRHAGEGVFFTSRMFDYFSILSGDLFYRRTRQDGDEWLIETSEPDGDAIGTMVTMRISRFADWTARSVFEAYQQGHVGFRKTHVPVSLGRYPGEQLVSRSQAKRLLSRFEQFSEIMLDFTGVDEIGQPFADEIFRVFIHSHPNIPVLAMGTNDQVERMIAHVLASAESNTG